MKFTGQMRPVTNRRVEFEGRQYRLDVVSQYPIGFAKGLQLLSGGLVKTTPQTEPIDHGEGSMPDPYRPGEEARFRLYGNQLDIHLSHLGPFYDAVISYVYDSSQDVWRHVRYLDIGSYEERLPVLHATTNRYRNTTWKKPLTRNSEGSIVLSDFLKVSYRFELILCDGTQETVIPRDAFPFTLRRESRAILVTNPRLGEIQIDDVELPSLEARVFHISDRESFELCSETGFFSVWNFCNDTGPGVERGEKLRPLVPHISECAPYISLLARREAEERLHPIKLCNQPFPEKMFLRSGIVSGLQGYGKSILLKAMLNDILLNRVPNDSDFRAVVSSPKNDLQPYLKQEHPDVSFIDTNVFHQDGVAHRLPELFADESAINAFVDHLVPTSTSNEPYWVVNTRKCFRIVVRFFVDTYQRTEVTFNLRTLCEATENSTVLHAILEQSIAGQNFLVSLEPNEKAWSGIASTLAEVLAPLRVIANLSDEHERAGRTFCLREFVDRKSPDKLLVLGDYPEGEESFKAYNRFLVFAFSRLARSPRYSPEVNHLRNLVLLDEVIDFAKVPEIGVFMQKARSVGGAVWGATQDYAALLELTKGKDTPPWANLFDTKIWLKSTLDSAKYASESMGKAMEEMVSWNKSQNSSHTDGTSVSHQFGTSVNTTYSPQGTSTSFGSNEAITYGRSESDTHGESAGWTLNLQARDVVLPADICADLPAPNPIDGVKGYITTDASLAGGIYSFNLPKSVWPSFPENHADVLDESFQVTRHWSKEELTQYGLSPDLMDSSGDGPQHSQPNTLGDITDEDTLRLLGLGGVTPFPTEESHDDDEEPSIFIPGEDE